MDFTTKSIKNPPFPLGRPGAIKNSGRAGNSRFKNSSSVAGNSSNQEASNIQSFAVAALDSVLLDLSREQPCFEDVTYGRELLDKLDDLKIAILDNTISRQDLLQLDKLIRDDRVVTDDPKLKEILTEIETRVAVEIAKLGL